MTKVRWIMDGTFSSSLQFLVWWWSFPSCSHCLVGLELRWRLTQPWMWQWRLMQPKTWLRMWPLMLQQLQIQPTAVSTPMTSRCQRLWDQAQWPSLLVPGAHMRASQFGVVSTRAECPASPRPSTFLPWRSLVAWGHDYMDVWTFCQGVAMQPRISAWGFTLKGWLFWEEWCRAAALRIQVADLQQVKWREEWLTFQMMRARPTECPSLNFAPPWMMLKGLLQLVNSWWTQLEVPAHRAIQLAEGLQPVARMSMQLQMPWSHVQFRECRRNIRKWCWDGDCQWKSTKVWKFRPMQSERSGRVDAVPPWTFWQWQLRSFVKWVATLSSKWILATVPKGLGK